MSSDLIYIGKRQTIENPINDRHYQELLGLNPTLSDEISKKVKDVLFKDFKLLSKSQLNDNNGIISEENIEKAKQELLEKLNELADLTGESAHILLVVDNCFTNKKLIVLLRRILGKNNFKKFVKIVSINYEKPAENQYLEENLSINNSLILLGGSLSDTYSIDNSHYDSFLANLIKETSDEYSSKKILNKRIIGVCFGQQYLANIIGIANKNSSGIIATIKGPTQFAPSNCNISDLKYVNQIYQEILSGLSNNGNNSDFTAYFTRSGYVNFDLLDSKWNLGVVPLITDYVTGGIVGWGSKNGNITGIQFHPELKFTKHKTTFKKHLKEIVPFLSDNKEEQNKFLNNFELQDKVKNNIGEAYYVFSILAYIKDIIKQHHKIKSFFNDEEDIFEVGSNEANSRLISTISSRVDFILNQDKKEDKEKSILDNNRQWIDKIDNKGRLLLNHMLDRKVNRSLGEVSEILGIKSLPNLILEHEEVQYSHNYIVRDLGAGDGNTIKELKKQLPKENIVIYGTGDYIYFDLYSAICQTEIGKILPQELIVLFVEKVILEFKKISSNSVIEKIKKSFENVTFSKDDKIFNSSMTGKDTYMFSCENEACLSKEIIDNFERYKILLDDLKKFTLDNLYSLFSDSFKKIYISKFNDLHIEDEVLSKIDFQYAIRSTSHVYGREYMKIISDYFYNSAKFGSIYIDNGVHQSYTSIPRLKELYEVSLDIVDGYFNLVYNPETNYFNSVIITKGVNYPDEFWEKHIDPSCILVSLKEAQRSTFFKFEYFIRNFIISNFKNQIVFWDFNIHIIKTLKYIVLLIENNEKEKIPFIIWCLINYIARKYKKSDIKYNRVEFDILENYSIDGQKLSDIIASELYTPTWMNINGIRKY